jgi:hypothetical protein
VRPSRFEFDDSDKLALLSRSLVSGETGNAASEKLPYVCGIAPPTLPVSYTIVNRHSRH